MTLRRRSSSLATTRIMPSLLRDKSKRYLEANWYKQAFKNVRIDVRSTTDLQTRGGGGVLATSIDGSLTGRGADLIIFDDPHKISDRPAQIDRVRSHFDQAVHSRLNNQRLGRVLVVAHRVGPDDLCARLIAEGNWTLLALPLICEKSTTYYHSTGVWHRKAGEVLRPASFRTKEIEALKRQAGFAYLYQQGVSSEARIEASDFPTFRNGFAPTGIVLSVDPAAGTGYSVIQAWRRDGKSHRLLDSYRQKVPFKILSSELARFVRKHNPSVILIEATSVGPALIDAARSHLAERVLVEAIVPKRSGKMDRLRRYAPEIKRGLVHVPEAAEWIYDFLAEVTAFPRPDTDDQIDAMTQYLDYAEVNPSVPLKPKPEVSGVVVTARDRTASFASIRDCITRTPGGNIYTWDRRR